MPDFMSDDSNAYRLSCAVIFLSTRFHKHGPLYLKALLQVWSLMFGKCNLRFVAALVCSSCCSATNLTGLCMLSGATYVCICTLDLGCVHVFCQRGTLRSDPDISLPHVILCPVVTLFDAHCSALFAAYCCQPHLAALSCMS